MLCIIIPRLWGDIKMHAIMGILTSKILIATISVLGCVTLLFSEDDIPSVAFATAVTALLASAIFLPTRRLAFSVYVAWAVTVIVVGTSSAKAQIAGMSLHSFDILFIAADPRAIVFLLRTYLSYALSMLLLLGIAAVVLVLFWRREAATRLRTPARIALVVTMGALSVATMPQWASSRDYYFQGRHASAFAASLRDIRHLFEAHPLGYGSGGRRLRRRTRKLIDAPVRSAQISWLSMPNPSCRRAILEPGTSPMRSWAISGPTTARSIGSEWKLLAAIPGSPLPAL